MNPRYEEFKIGKPKIIPKPWGRELWLVQTDKYAGKILEINKGTQLSLQYHEEKKESMFMLKGEMIMTNGKNETVMKEGDCVTIEPGQVHRLIAKTDVRVIEVSTPELHDVVRMQDEYDREGKKEQHEIELQPKE